MPIFNPESDSISESLLNAIQAIELTGGAGGNPRYRFSAFGRLELTANKPTIILPELKNPVSREIRLMVVGSVGSLRVFWGTDESSADSELLEVRAGEIFYDPFDGGMRLNAIVSDNCEVAIIIRQDVPITYKLETGNELMPNTSVELWVDTLFNYAEKVSDFDIYSKIQSICQSDEGIAGYKLFYLTGFTQNEPLTITVDASFASVNPPIQIQWLNQEKFLWLISMFGITEHLYDLPSEVLQDFTGNFIYAGETTSATGGDIIVIPTLSRCLGRIVARNTITNVNNTCVITGWTPDVNNPKQGGTLTIGGF